MPELNRRALERQIRSQLDKLVFDLNTYRVTMERIFSRKLSRPRECRRYFLQVLVSASQLYLDHVVVMNDMPKLEEVSLRAPEIKPLTTNLDRQGLLRQRFRDRLDSLPCWSLFLPEKAFSECTKLRTLEDYINIFAHHLPEVHEETFRVEEYAKRFRDNYDSSALAGLTVGLQHLGRNHISFVHFALEWAADESSWRA